MIAAGILTEDDRVELIRGEIVKMAAVGAANAVCVSDLSMLLTETVRRAARVWSQSPIRLSNSEPESDVVLSRLRPDRYKSGLPTSADIYLLIEVADSSLAYDRSVKIPLYAEAGIPEVWLVNLNEDVVEVYTQPSNGQYGSMHTSR